MKKSSLLKKIGAALTSAALAATMTVGMAGTAFAEPGQHSDTGLSQEVTVTVKGATADQDKSVTLTPNSDLVKNGKTAGYMYKRYVRDGQLAGNYVWVALAGKNIVTLDQMIQAATGSSDVSQYWKNGSKLDIYAYEYVSADEDYQSQLYGKFDFTYSALSGQNQFFGYMQAEDTFKDDNSNPTADSPIGVAFQYKTEDVLAGTTDSTYLNIKNASDFDKDTRFVMGLDSSTVTLKDNADGNMGRRLPYGVTDIIIYPNGK